MLKRLGPAVLVAVLVLPASAMGATTLGSALSSAPDGVTGTCSTTAACTNMLKQIGSVDQKSPIDGVVVSWAVRATNADSGVHLRIVHPTDATHYTPWLTAPAVNLAGTGAVERFAARIPITRGDYLAVIGTDDQVVPIYPMLSPSGSANVQFAGPFADRTAPSTGNPPGNAEELLQATIEPDVDGDGYGDESQDACPHDAHDQAAPCGATTVGPSTLLAFDAGNGCGGPPTCLWVNPDYPVPTSGVIVRYRVQTTNSGGFYAVRPVTIAGLNGIAGVASVDAPPTAVGANTIESVHVPVASGDFIGLRDVAPAGIAQYDSGHYDGFAPDPASGSGSPFTPQGATIAFNADIEPDADHDTYGDSTQDPCPFDAANHTHACVADLQLSSPVVPGPLIPLPNPATTGLSVTNAGPSGAANTVVTLTPPTGSQLVGATSTLGTCTTAATVTCTLGTMTSGATASISVGVLATTAGSVTLAAHGSSDASDPNPADNAVSLFASFGPAIVIPPPPAKPCSVSKQGTGKENTIAGTSFGDKISGLGGRDIIHGNDGDDCVYGGLGDDVLYGDRGNDKLYGQTGNDRLIGGDGDDQLSGSTGKDSLAGGAGVDTLSGGVGDDTLSGGAGNDTLSPGIGHDHVDAGSGNDTISAVDHARDTVDCGTGTDTATVDKVDAVSHCEHVKRR